jgi:two-component system response regulator AtoC
MRVGALRPRMIDVRFVAATNRDLDASVADGSFRADLYYRLHGMGITIPPLAERVGEIAALARLFVLRACERAGRSPLELAGPVIDRLERYSWPGNVRELRNVMERATALCSGDVIEVDHLPAALALGASGATPGRGPSKGPSPLAPQARVPLRDSVRAIERQQIVEALARCAGNQSAAAALLGMPRRTLVARLTEYEIPRPHKRRSP